MHYNKTHPHGMHSSSTILIGKYFSHPPFSQNSDKKADENAAVAPNHSGARGSSFLLRAETRSLSG